MPQTNYTFLRSYVRTEEYDLTQQVDSNSGTIGAISGEFRRGPSKPTYVAPTAFYNKYGEKADPSLSFAWDTASVFSASSANMLLNRVTNEALHAGLDVVFDDDTVYGQRVLMLPFVVGAEVGYDQNGKVNTSGVDLLKFSALMQTGDKFEMTITDGATVVPIAVTFNGSHNDTLAAIALAINDAMQSYSPTTSGDATSINEVVSPLANRYTIAIRRPFDASLELLNASVETSGGVDRPIVSLVEAADCWLWTDFAENQGKWADNYGMRVLDIDRGVRERFRLTMSGPFVTGNVVGIQINGNDISVPFNTDSDTTLADLAIAIAAEPDVLSATVENIIGATNNDRTMLITARLPGVERLIISNPVVTLGASQPIGNVLTILKGQESSGIFNTAIYSTSAGVNAPVETYQFSLFKQTNGRGEQTYFDSVVNQGTGASINMRIVGNPALATSAAFEPILEKLLDGTVFRSTVAWMAGGDDGLSVTTSQMIQSLQPLTDRVRYPVNLFLSAGYTDIAYMQALDELAQQRGDCTTILDMPTEKQAAQDAHDFRMFELNIDSSYSAIYTPNTQIKDISTSEDRFIPPSGPVAAAYVYNDVIRNRYAAPAGLNRGPLRKVLGLSIEYTPTELEMLNPVGINTIVNKRATGPTVMSEETLQYKKSALSSVHIRRTVNDVKTLYADGLEYSLFEASIESTWFNIRQLGETILGPAKRAQGLYDYLIKCDADNNPPEVQDQDVIVVDIYIKPVRVAKGIILRTIITRTAVSFQEITATFNI